MRKNSQNGYIILMSVIILSALGAAVVSTMLILALSHGQSGSAAADGVRANALAEGCAESALNSLREDGNYGGSENIVLTSGDCSILQIEFQDSVYTIKTSAASAEAVSKILITAQRAEGPPAYMQIVSWQPVTDF